MPETRRPILSLDSVHKSMNLVAVLPESVGGRKRKRPIGDNRDSGSKRQATHRKGVSSVEVRKLVTEYIIDDMFPLITVESPAFKKLVDELSPHPVQLPDRKTICLHLEQVYESMMKKDQGKPGRSRESFHHSRCLDGTPQKLSLYDRPLD